MSDSNTAVAPALQDRFANAPVLPFERSREWFAQARRIALQSPVFLVLAALLVLLARWQLDLFGNGELIVLSFLTDAVFFTWVYLGIAVRQGDPTASAWRSGRIALRGRWWRVAVCSLWGLPAAMVSHAMFAFAPELIKVLVVALGSNLAGLVVLLLLVLAAAYATFLLSMLPVLAAIQAGRDEAASFKVAGLWAVRALRAGHRPLAAVFVTFISSCVVAGAGLSYLYGHLSVQWLAQAPGLDALLAYWYPWPGLFVALCVFLALLQPMASDMLAAADVDLSDEILADHHKAEHGARHVDWLLRRAGFGLRAAAALNLLLGVLYESLLGGGQWLEWAASALVLFAGGKLLDFWGRRTAPQPPQATAVAEATTTTLPIAVRVLLALLRLGQWLSLIGLVGLQTLLFLIDVLSGHGNGDGELLLWVLAVPLSFYLARKGLERWFRRS